VPRNEELNSFRSSFEGVGLNNKLKEQESVMTAGRSSYSSEIELQKIQSPFNH